jgi:putative ABC transport system permease protein
MIKFLLKGLLRDRSRSLFPIITVAFGAFLNLFMAAFMDGVMGNMYNTTAHHSTGHVKIMTRAYAAEADQKPNDLALLDVSEFLQKVQKDYPDIIWVQRISFGGLIDVPDKHGETKAQGPSAGMAVDLFSPNSPELEHLNLTKSIAQGRLPQKSGEILLADDFANRLNVSPGDTVSLIGSTMHGSMQVVNFKLAGTVRFGIAALDRGAIVADLRDIQHALDMEDAAGEILGFFSDGAYDDAKANSIRDSFNAKYSDPNDEFSPIMRTLIEESGMAGYFNMAEVTMFFLTLVFVATMALVLWNAGLISGIRRYGEMGVRLAIGESKPHIYGSMLWEALLIGTAGSLIGSAFGLALSLHMQVNGLDLSAVFQNTSMMMNATINTRVTLNCIFMGLVPGRNWYFQTPDRTVI